MTQMFILRYYACIMCLHWHEIHPKRKRKRKIRNVQIYSILLTSSDPKPVKE